MSLVSLITITSWHTATFANIVAVIRPSLTLLVKKKNENTRMLCTVLLAVFVSSSLAIAGIEQTNVSWRQICAPVHRSKYDYKFFITLASLFFICKTNRRRKQRVQLLTNGLTARLFASVGKIQAKRRDRGSYSYNEISSKKKGIQVKMGHKYSYKTIFICSISLQEEFLALPSKIYFRRSTFHCWWHCIGPAHLTCGISSISFGNILMSLMHNEL